MVAHWRVGGRLVRAGATCAIVAALVTACGTAGGNSSNASNATGATSEAATRTIKTVKGDVTIPAHPQRIVTDYYAGELISVGGHVVGAAPLEFGNPFLKDQLKDATDVGDPINVEKALSLKPDLIVTDSDKNYDELSKIAPTLYIPFGTTHNIQETVRFFENIVGEKEQGEQVLAQYEKAAENGRNALKGVIDPKATAGLYELTDKGDLWVFGDNFGRGGQALYNALQMKMPPKLAESKKEYLQISLETLPQYAADYMFLTTYDPQHKGQALKDLRQSPVWNGLKAVKEGDVFYNDFNTFYPYDPISITKQIDLFVRMLTEKAKEQQGQSSGQ
ncbi:iron complex transport system substrate-binding protein [Alicyclobacillus macrosporangiidus]|uniref:Iron complex transport system substrate-binding protein n=1 Tax=Alicyclobacillus macrosporangiidus TaxID=392015 RepID=A0A1I7JL80_9BACL|nr:iron complex transport system substrate-binding protein [Alicyclobacillus macrosporangiidus]